MSETILETSGLTKSFGGFIAVKDVNLSVRRHTIHALIGPNGAGKSTVFNLITKFLMPTSGQIRLNGRDITRVKPAALARRGMVRSFQISSVFPHLTVAENVRVALQRTMGNSFQFWRSERVLDRLHDEVDEILETVGLMGVHDALAVELPYGRKRLLELATTLALKPEVMLFDEPMAGMGMGDIKMVSDLIRKAAEGRTVLMVEHNLGVVADLSDTITVLQRGQVLAEGSYEEVSKNRDVISAYMGGGVSEVLLKVDDLHAWYGESHILHGMNFEVRAGEVVTLIGRNGAGKTTTLRSVMGLVRARTGSVAFDGTETIDLQANKVARLGIALVPEERGIFASLNVLENLTLPPIIAEGGMALDEVYALFPILKERGRSQGTKLSGGEQQMLAIARILRTGAKLLLLDEPTEGLAPVIVEQIGRTIAELRRRNFTILLVEQNFRFASSVADRHYVVEHGTVIDEIANDAVGENREKLTQYLGV